MTRQVLVVDDMTTARSAIRMRLQPLGWTVREAASADQAWQVLISEPIDVVVTDHILGDISGLQLCRLLRASPRLAHLPLILVTGYDERRTRAWARYAGADAFVTKGRIDLLGAEVERVAALGRIPAQVDQTNSDGGSISDRLRTLLDDTLRYTSVMADVRALARHTEPSPFAGDLFRLLSEHVEYRWGALSFAFDPLLYVHTCRAAAPPVLKEARAQFAAIGVQIGEARNQRGREPVLFADDELEGLAPAGASVFIPLMHGQLLLGQLAVAPGPHGFTAEEAGFLDMVAAELGPGLRVIELIEATRRQAETDPLTGLNNRRGLLEQLRRIGTNAVVGSASWGVLLLDVDHFKRVNDEYGHETGDVVLARVASCLVGRTRASDIAGRWGGEEFVLVVRDSGRTGLNLVAERLRSAVEELQLYLSTGEELRVTVSIGVAMATPGATFEQVLERADDAMYQAKERGRNQVVCAPGEARSPVH